MPLDRQDIQRRDFPISRRGYETQAVDAHLRRLADEIDQVKRSQQRGSDSLAAAASEQVRAIVEAAETTSSDIQRHAESEARTIRDEASSDAQTTRDEAAVQARDHVANVSEATKGMLQRVDAMESELGALVESLRTGTNRLHADLTLLQGNMGELRAASAHAEAGDAPAPALDEPAEEAEPGDLDDELEPQAGAAGPELEPESAELGEAESTQPEAEDDAAVTGPMGEADDTEGARLIALNMALNGTPREETDRYLAENFDLDDRDTLLDEVYARVG